MASQSTVLLTIYNRYKFTKRWLDYAKQKKFKINIFICDGGKPGDFNKFINLGDYKSLNLKYFKAKYTKDYSRMFDKFYQAIKKIKTDFVYLAEDDDFIIEHNIFKSEKFLIKNEDFSSSAGMNVNIEQFVYNQKKSKLFIRLPNYNNSIREKNPIDRFIKGLRFVNSNYNSLHRKRSLEKIFFFLKEKKFHNLYITELVIYLYSLLNGKSKRFNHLEYLKFDNINYSASKKFSENYLKKIILNKNFSVENYYFLNFIEKKKLAKNKNYQNFKKIYFEFLADDLEYRIKKKNKIDLFLRKKIKNTLLEKSLRLFYRLIKYYNLKNYDIFYNHKKSKKYLLNDINFIFQIYKFLNEYKKL